MPPQDEKARVPSAVYVIDTGFLRSRALVEFLSASGSNRVAVSERTKDECCGGDALRNLDKSLLHLRRYPDRVLMLRSAKELIREQDQTGFGPSRDALVYAEETASFSAFCRDVGRAAAGDLEFVRGARSFGDDATRNLERFRADAVTFANGIKSIKEEMDKDRLGRIRKGDTWTADDEEWLRNTVMDLATDRFCSHPDVTRLPPQNVMTSSWLFRHSLAGFLLAMWWIRNGGIESVLPERLANDLKDSTISTFGTYFDGVLTLDKKLAELHQELRSVLKSDFGTTPGE